MKLFILSGEGGPLARTATAAERLARLSFDIVHDAGTADQVDVFQPQTGSRLINAELNLATRRLRRRLRDRLSPGFQVWRRQIHRLECRQFTDPSRLIAVSGMVRNQIASRARRRARTVHAAGVQLAFLVETLF